MSIQEFSKIANEFGGAKHNPIGAFEINNNKGIAVVLCHFNPCLYEAPVQNLKNVLHWLVKEEIPTFGIELRCGLSLGQKPILPENHKRVLQLASNSTIFRKDNLWNIANLIVPTNFKFILFLDADTLIIGDDWQEQLRTELEKTKIVQPFSKAIWTDSLLKPFKEKLSCGFGLAKSHEQPHSSKFFHSGFGIAVHRSFFTETPGFYNSPIGGGSLFLISAITGAQNELEANLREISYPFLKHYHCWAELVLKWSDGKLGFVNCEAWHLWHGSRKKRKYIERFEKLKGFDPDFDIESVGPYGLHEWSDRARSGKSDMINSVHNYFDSREEDEWFDSRKI